MLILTRRPGEMLVLDLQDWVSPDMTVGEFFAEGEMLICIRRLIRNEVRLGIQAPMGMRVLREELLRRRGRGQEPLLE